jgi:hypothetical protein
MKYIALPGTWFDAGTEAILLADCRQSDTGLIGVGLFEGIHNGKPDQEMCGFDEFEEIK